MESTSSPTPTIQDFHMGSLQDTTDTNQMSPGSPLPLPLPLPFIQILDNTNPSFYNRLYTTVQALCVDYF